MPATTGPGNMSVLMGDADMSVRMQGNPDHLNTTTP
jgi:hypothetical protein